MHVGSRDQSVQRQIIQSLRYVDSTLFCPLLFLLHTRSATVLSLARIHHHPVNLHQ